MSIENGNPPARLCDRPRRQLYNLFRTVDLSLTVARY